MTRSASFFRALFPLLRALSLGMFFAGQLLSAQTIPASAAPTLEGGPLEPYRIERVRIHSAAGTTRDISIRGIPWEGEPRLLFTAQMKAPEDSLDAALYLDEELRSLVVEEAGPGGTASRELPLTRPLGEEESENSYSAMIRAYPLPIGDPPQASAPGAFSLKEDSLESASRRAAAELFALPPSGSLPYLLGGYALILVLLTARGTARPPRFIAAMLVLTSIASGLVTANLPHEAFLYSLALPEDHPESRVSGKLEVMIRPDVGYREIRYGEDGPLDFLGIYAPNSCPIPLEALASNQTARFHFDHSPLIVNREGRLWLVTEGLVLGWRHNGRP